MMALRRIEKEWRDSEQRSSEQKAALRCERVTDYAWRIHALELTFDASFPKDYPFKPVHLTLGVCADSDSFCTGQSEHRTLPPRAAFESAIVARSRQIWSPALTALRFVECHALPLIRASKFNASPCDFAALCRCSTSASARDSVGRLAPADLAQRFAQSHAVDRKIPTRYRAASFYRSNRSTPFECQGFHSLHGYCTRWGAVIVWPMSGELAAHWSISDDSDEDECGQLCSRSTQATARGSWRFVGVTRLSLQQLCFVAAMHARMPLDGRVPALIVENLARWYFDAFQSGDISVRGRFDVFAVKQVPPRATGDTDDDIEALRVARWLPTTHRRWTAPARYTIEIGERASSSSSRSPTLPFVTGKGTIVPCSRFDSLFSSQHGN
jgi:hypothetical protein